MELLQTALLAFGDGFAGLEFLTHETLLEGGISRFCFFAGQARSAKKQLYIIANIEKFVNRRWRAGVVLI